MVLVRLAVVEGAEFDDEKTIGTHRATSDDMRRPLEPWYLAVTRIIDV
jgi:hypothetical protein